MTYMRGTDHLGIGTRVILKWILKKYDVDMICACGFHERRGIYE
jgi:hypothetical protein